MNLETAFPPFGLRIEAGPLTLRPITVTGGEWFRRFVGLDE
ncbi:hypothetical protein [Acidipropionibacterium virtanenii]|nr:hypothetical protein [Acidipropionibacterium virtanenii]